MIAKKNPSLELEGKRKIFLQIGLLTVGSLTLAAFTYKSPTTIESEKLMVKHSPVEFKMELVQKPEPLKTQTQTHQQNTDQNNDQQQQTIDINKSVDENTKSSDNKDKDVKSDVGLKDLGYEFGDFVDLTGGLLGEVVEIPDVDAEFIGGYGEMQKFITTEVQYPEISLTWGEQGTVWTSFVVETDGSISDIKVERGVSADLDKEALRVVRQFPKWKPGEVDAQPVRTRVRLPITFVIEK